MRPFTFWSVLPLTAYVTGNEMPCLDCVGCVSAYGVCEYSETHFNVWLSRISFQQLFKASKFAFQSNL